MSKTKAAPAAPKKTAAPAALTAAAKVIADATAVDEKIDTLAAAIDETRHRADQIIARIKGCADVRQRAKQTLDDALLTSDTQSEKQARAAISHANETQDKSRAELRDVLHILDKHGREQDTLRVLANDLVTPVRDATEAMRREQIGAQHRMSRAGDLSASLRQIRREIEDAADLPSPASAPAAAADLPICPQCRKRDHVVHRGGYQYHCVHNGRKFLFDVRPPSPPVAAEPEPEPPVCPRCLRNDNVKILPSGEFQCSAAFHGPLTFKDV